MSSLAREGIDEGGGWVENGGVEVGVGVGVGVGRVERGSFLWLMKFNLC